MDAIDTRIEALKKEVDLDGRCERLLSSVARSNRFRDQNLISELCCDYVVSPLFPFIYFPI